MLQRFTESVPTIAKRAVVRLAARATLFVLTRARAGLVWLSVSLERALRRSGLDRKAMEALDAADAGRKR